MSDWREYWERHALDSRGADPLSRVQRVQDRKPISPEAFEAVSAQALDLLQLESHHDVLDLCCGNGLLSQVMEPHCGSILGMDFCEELLCEVAGRTTAKTAVVAADVRSAPIAEDAFDRVLFAAALQHLQPGDVVGVFEKIVRSLRVGGRLVVTDIPDMSLVWKFFDTDERVSAHFAAIKAGVPILGSWFSRTWLEKLARHVGFREARALDQPPRLPYAHYRFDLCCVR